MSRYVYADNAATTPISKEVLSAMLPYLQDDYGNPSSLYRKGRDAAKAVRLAREKVASGIGALPSEIFFTSGGSEADNWAIKGVAERLGKEGKKHVVTASFEHHAVLNTCRKLELEGFAVTRVNVNPLGFVRAEDVAAAIREDTALVTIMYANNEIGTIQPIAEIGALCRERGVLFHTDAVQAAGNVEIDVAARNIDLLSLSGHKLNGPKGIGALFIRKGINIPNFIEGGAQEGGKRAGTENVPAIVGMGAAVERACTGIEDRAAKVRSTRNRLIDEILKLPGTRLNGCRENRLPGNINVSFEGVESEALIMMLDQNGVAASSGSACTSGTLEPSHVLLSIGVPREIANGSLRLTINGYTTGEDMEHILKVLPPAVERLRRI